MNTDKITPIQIKNALGEVGYLFREFAPMKITPNVLAKLIRKQYGLYCNPIAKNEAMLFSRMPKAKEIFKIEVACYDVHLDMEQFCKWLKKNIPMMKTTAGSKFDLPKLSNMKARNEESMSSLGALRSVTVRNRDNYRTVSPSNYLISDPSFQRLPGDPINF